MKVAIFLGAGASAAEGAPIQSSLFRDFFNNRRNNNFYQDGFEGELATFFQLMFGIDVYSANEFPTFEEVLGLIDIAEKRNESFKEYDLENLASNSNQLRMIRVYLIRLLAQIIHESLLHGNGTHKRLIRNLIDNEDLQDVFFISANYDILIDNAISDIFNNNGRAPIDYGIPLTNTYREKDWRSTTKKSVDLFKIHGSLNWLYCSSCNTVTLTPGEKGIIRISNNFHEASCQSCESVLTPIIIPPTFFKEMSNTFINQIWYKTEQKLRKCEHIIFCGYSFPDADMHVKYLLKRAQINTDKLHTMNFTVINNHEGKTQESKDFEENRYERFLGRNVNYEDISFEEFAANPQQIINV